MRSPSSPSRSTNSGGRKDVLEVERCDILGVRIKVI